MTDAPIRLLICEDQELVRAGYTTIFSSQPDMEVIGEAADGRAAIEAARRLSPDVIVSVLLIVPMLVLAHRRGGLTRR